MLGSPSKKDLQGLVSGNMIANCPFSLSDVTNTKIMYRPDIPRTQGATVRRRPALVVTDYVAVPHLLVEANKVITLAVDVFFVDGMAFLLKVSRRLKFVTVEHVPVRTATHLSKHIKRVLDVYGRAGFRIRTILMDGEFEKVKPFLPTLECNTRVVTEHVSKAEDTICTLKERTRGSLALLPFSHIPRRIKIEFVYVIVLWLNAFLIKSEISTIYSPRELLVCWKLDYKKHCRVLPGSYCKVHDEPVPINTMVVHMHACIALGPTGNLQGSMKFYCLTTGRVLKCRLFTVIPMPDRIICQVNEIGVRKGQGRTFRFLNQRREPYS